MIKNLIQYLKLVFLIILLVSCSTLSGNINYEIYDQYNKAIDFRKLGYEFYEKGNYEKALEYYLGAYKIFINIDSNEKIIGLLSDIINLYNRTKDFSNSKKYIEYGTNFLTYEKVTSKEVGFFYQCIGDYYNFVNQKDLAIDYYNRSITYFKMNKEDENVATTYLIIGKVYSSINDLNKAIKYLDDAIRILENLYKQKKLENFENLSSSYYVRSIHYLNNNNFKKSVEYMRKTIQLDRLREKSFNLSQDYYIIALNYYKLKDFKTFVFNIQKSISISMNSNNYDAFTRATELLGDYYLNDENNLIEAINNYKFSYNITTGILNNEEHKYRILNKIRSIIEKEGLEDTQKEELLNLLTKEIKDSINIK